MTHKCPEGGTCTHPEGPRDCRGFNPGHRCDHHYDLEADELAGCETESDSYWLGRAGYCLKSIADNPGDRDRFVAIAIKVVAEMRAKGVL
jgi:hypothetical protein